MSRRSREGFRPYQVQAPKKNTGRYKHRLLIGTPTMGTVRIEWHNHMQGLVIPTNWQTSTQTPIGFLVADGQNIIANEAIARGFEWVLLVEDDVLVPADLFQRMADWMERGDVPIVSGLYHLKGSVSPEPIMYRGRGAGAFRDWKPGTAVWVDGVPTGCLLIHGSILQELAKIRPEYEVRANGQAQKLIQIFETPRKVFTDPALQSYHKLVGTSDLYFCDQLMEHDVLKKAGWSKVAKKKWPFVVDTAIRCGHIDRESGVAW